MKKQFTLLSILLICFPYSDMIRAEGPAPFEVLNDRNDGSTSIGGTEVFNVKDTLSTWFDYSRKGKAAKNMKEQNLREATRRGSWGVGRYYFRVETERGRVFDIYYDRAPKDASDRAGHWFLWREMEEKSGRSGE